ncbi:MAG: hypothetical protein JRH11_13800 [Deltaproteobacteria bacterium]|nr:hypothetical protein [Deltaproteobacteria bacterium]
MQEVEGAKMRADVFSTALTATLIVGLGALSSGCLERELTPLIPCTQSGVVEKVRVSSVDKVDLLFMIDNSNSMTEEQVSLAQQLPHLIEVLASGDQDGDGVEDFPAVRDLNVGVITSDMGTGGFGVPTCSEPNFGDDGALRSTGNTAIAGCPGMFSTGFLNYVPATATTTPSEFAMDVSCIAVVGTGGCGFEQQLEATLKAVTSSGQPPVGRFDGTFNMGTTGHADGANGGFIRPDSLLAIIEVTDEEDCSALDPELFNPTSSIYTGDLNLRCFQFPGAVQPTGRYVDGLLASRITPDLLVYAIIAGVPTDAVPAPGADPNFDAILAHPDMVEQIDPDMMTRLKPSCNVAGRGLAFPPRRMVQVAKELSAAGAGGIVQSICQADFTPALDAIIAKIADVLGGACLPRELNPNEDGTVNCQVLETLPITGEVTRCDQIAGRTFLTTDADTGGQVCEVLQLAALGGASPTDPGWFYDNFTSEVLMRCGEAADDGQRISYTSGNEPRTGTLVRLECLQPVQPTGAAGVRDIYSPCTSATDTVCPATDSTCARDLICDPESQEWQVECTTDASCPAGFRCVTGRADGLANICTNPTC